ncbi:Gfo/Idh/MocA family oxidoreductase [Gramella sp. AN32]|uniref:Gfo/Idh/MocA family protein n=1 Tax=Christiangramia antarctica TaxID=2058158 RepID=A0ABW5X6S7_9FLAO|nr:Gfo/Idh/MocA family oxidoreductase [Gramella sp. AN32]MCM4156044.1 oxidoreductase [Gramella sp. AN32]
MINWGILGPGKIAHKFATGLKDVKGAKLYAVASREVEKAKIFSSEFNAEKSYGNYEELMQDPDVDVIYIATPHVFHHRQTIQCLQNGKAVLCEKPMGINAAEVEEMIKLAKEKNLFLMEALWTQFLPHFEFVKHKITSGELGKIKSLEADFGFFKEFDPESRLFNKSLGGGSLLDIGIYPIFLALELLGMPDEIVADAKFTETNVDSECIMEFQYPHNVKASLFSTIQQETPTTAEITLEKGKIHLDSRFHEPTSVKVFTPEDEKNFEFEIPSNGYYFEAKHVTEMLQQGKKESPLMSFEKSLNLISLIDEVKSKIGLSYS